MSIKDRLIRTVGLLMFMVGLVVGLVFSGLLTWAEIEAMMFDPYPGDYDQLATLRCPVLVGPGEVGTVSATFTNPLDRPVLRTLYVYTSGGSVIMMQENREQITLEPGETRRLEWPVTAQDAAWRRFILVRVFTIRRSPLPALTGFCGIVTVNLFGLNGHQVVALAFGVSLVCMVVGSGLWLLVGRSLRGRNRGAIYAMAALTVIVLVGMVSGMLRWWVVSGGLFMLAVLLSTVSIERAVNA